MGRHRWALRAVVATAVAVALVSGATDAWGARLGAGRSSPGVPRSAPPVSAATARRVAALTRLAATALDASLARRPPVAAAVTDGRPEAGLYHTAVALSAVGGSSAGLRARVARAEAVIGAAAASARADETAAGATTVAADTARVRARAAAERYGQLRGGVEEAALRLYMSGGVIPPTATTVAGAQQLAWAQDYLDTVVEPRGALAALATALVATRAETLMSTRAQATAAAAVAGAAAGLARQRATTARLAAELTALDVGHVAAVLADHQALAAQEATELINPRALQFTPTTALPAPVTSTTVALTWAFAELGRPYRWGGTGPSTFDCSGLMQFIWKHAGVPIPRVAAQQDAWTDPVPLSQLVPGDLVFYGSDDIHHVGVYIGDGLMINAPHTGTVVQVSSIWWSDLAGFGRVHAVGTPTARHVLPSARHPAATVTTVKKRVPSEAKPPAHRHGRRGVSLSQLSSSATDRTVPVGASAGASTSRAGARSRG